MLQLYYGCICTTVGVCTHIIMDGWVPNLVSDLIDLIMDSRGVIIKNVEIFVCTRRVVQLYWY
jgi:hypothetical protein